MDIVLKINSASNGRQDSEIVNDLFENNASFFTTRNVPSGQELYKILSWRILPVEVTTHVIFSQGFRVDYVNKEMFGYVVESDDMGKDISRLMPVNVGDGVAVLKAFAITDKRTDDVMGCIEESITRAIEVLSTNNCWPHAVADVRYTRSRNTSVFVSLSDRYVGVFRCNSAQNIYFMYIKTCDFIEPDADTVTTVQDRISYSRVIELHDLIERVANDCICDIVGGTDKVHIVTLWKTSFNCCLHGGSLGYQIYVNCYHMEKQNMMPIVGNDIGILWILSDDGIMSVYAANMAEDKILDSLSTAGKVVNLASSLGNIGYFEPPSWSARFLNDMVFYDSVWIDIKSETSRKRSLLSKQNLFFGDVYANSESIPSVTKLLDYESAAPSFAFEDISREFKERQLVLPHAEVAISACTILNTPTYIFRITPRERLHFYNMLTCSTISIMHDDDAVLCEFIKSTLDNKKSLKTVAATDDSTLWTFNVRDLLGPEFGQFARDTHDI